jgi:hypothetical protein
MVLSSYPAPLALLLGGCFVTQADQDLASDRDHDGFIASELGGSDCDDDNASAYSRPV